MTGTGARSDAELGVLGEGGRAVGTLHGDRDGRGTAIRPNDVGGEGRPRHWRGNADRLDRGGGLVRIERGDVTTGARVATAAAGALVLLNAPAHQRLGRQGKGGYHHESGGEECFQHHKENEV